MSRMMRPWAAWALAAYLVAVVGVLLSPISPEEAVSRITSLLRDDLGWTGVRQGWVEFAANIALFFPLGLLVTALFRRVWIGVLLALMLSVAAEAVQLFLPSRLASPRDVLANVVGAALGAALAWLVLRSREPRSPVRSPDG